MKLKLISLVENQDKLRWGYSDLLLREINLIVGVNASGKSKTIRSIDLLAELLSKRQQLSSMPQPMHWTAEFIDDDSGTYIYELQTDKCAVVKETLTKDDTVLISRTPDATATIYNSAVKNMVEFKVSDGDLAVVAKRDQIQAPFLEPLFLWASSVQFYRFGTSLGQDTLGLKGIAQLNVEQFEHEAGAVIPKFSIGNSRFPDTFSATLKADMNRLNYSLEEVSLAAPSNVVSGPPGMVTLAVKESDLDCPTEQYGMSQGMFRAFSLLIQTNVISALGKMGCLLIDDIGEGLDYSRSCALIDLLVEKSKSFGFQLIMATNDRFIMNHVPLENWTVIRRIKGEAKIFNYTNSKEHFDEFRFTGLNNFDFLATDFLDQTIEKKDGEGSPNEKTGGVH